MSSSFTTRYSVPSSLTSVPLYLPNSTLSPTLTWGARSWVAGASNFLAPEHVALYRTCVVEQDMIAGRELASRLLPMLNLLEQGGKFCQYIKYGCELAGLPVGPTRRPLLPLGEHEKAAFARAYEQLIAHRG